MFNYDTRTLRMSDIPVSNHQMSLCLIRYMSQGEKGLYTAYKAFISGGGDVISSLDCLDLFVHPSNTKITFIGQLSLLHPVTVLHNIWGRFINCKEMKINQREIYGYVTRYQRHVMIVLLCSTVTPSPPHPRINPSPLTPIKNPHSVIGHYLDVFTISRK